IAALSVFLAGVFLSLFATANPLSSTRKSARNVDAQMRRPGEISLALSGGVHEVCVARYNGPGNDFYVAEAIAVDGSGNIYVTGGSRNVSGFSDYVTIKYSSAGQEVWVSRYYSRPGNYPDDAYAIGIDGSGNAYVAGTSLFYSSATYDYGTIKYNSSWQQQWADRYNG